MQAVTRGHHTPTDSDYTQHQHCTVELINHMRQSHSLLMSYNSVPFTVLTGFSDAHCRLATIVKTR